MGIAVGMATKIPPHKLREIAGGLKALVDNPEASIAETSEGVIKPVGAALFAALGLDLKRCLIYI